MSIELKIKSKHLGEESKIIRHEERKLKKQIFWAYSTQKTDAERRLRATWFSLNSHRRIDVRNEARATFLARAFIAGKPYLSVETKPKDGTVLYIGNNIWNRVAEMVLKYGSEKNLSKSNLLENLKAWRDK